MSLTPTAVVRLADICEAKNDDIECMTYQLDPILRSHESEAIYDHIVNFSSKSGIHISVLTEFVRELLETLRSNPKKPNPYEGPDRRHASLEQDTSDFKELEQPCMNTEEKSQE